MAFGAGFPPQNHGCPEDRSDLGRVPDAREHAVVGTARHGGVQDHGVFDRLETEARGLARRGHEVEHRDREDFEAKVRFGDLHDRHADRGRIGTAVRGAVRCKCREVVVRALRNDGRVRVADQPRRKFHLDVLQQLGRERKGFVVFGVVFERLVEVHSGCQLVRMASGLRVGRPVFLFGLHLEAFDAELGRFATDLKRFGVGCGGRASTFDRCAVG